MNKIQKILLSTLFLALFLQPASPLKAQDWLHEVQSTDRSQTGNTPPDFYELRRAFDRYYQNHPDRKEGDTEYIRFKRWEAFMEPRVYPSGQFFPPSAIYKASEELDHRPANKTTSGNWTLIGPDNPGWGRVNCIAIDPTNANTYWVGTPGGGIWKSINSGSSWTEMTGTLPTLSIANIVIDPNNTDIIYLATGDHYGYMPAGWPLFTGGTYSLGVMKSTDGGQNWNPTGLSYEVADKMILRRLILDPNNSNILFAASSNGVWRSADAGATWQRHKSGNIYDMEFQPGNSNTLYAVTDTVFKSTDGGLNWAQIPGAPIFPQNTFYRRVSVAVSPAAPNNVYLVGSELNDPGLFYLSTDAGTTFSPLNPAGTTFYGYWDNVLTVSPTNPNHIIAGGANIEHTTDGGTTWNSLSTGYVDHHDAVFLPNGTDVLLANDGGIFRSTGNSNTNLSFGLQLTQYYAMGGSATDPDIIFGGVQDRGTIRLKNGLWDRVLPNDGAESLVDYTDPNIVYSSWQYGNFRKSIDGGDNYTPITPGPGSWTAPMVMHPSNPQILFYGGGEVRKSVDGGANWNDISTTISGQVISLAVAKSNPDYIYAATYYRIHRTTNGGTNWTDISGTLPTPSNAISGIAISGSDPDAIWVSLSGYVPGEKAYRTTDGGSTWSNISGTLPNSPANCIEYDNTSGNDGVYLGTDLGVFYRDNGQSDWIYFNSDLPRVIVHELEIHYGTGMLRAATHGRGMWESPLMISVGVSPEPVSEGSISVYPGVTKGRVWVDVERSERILGNEFGEDKVRIEVLDMRGGKILERESSGPTAALQTELDLSGTAEGLYLVKVDAGFGMRVVRILVQR